MESPHARILTRILAVLYGTLGILLFLAPEWSSQNFAWKVSPWVAMTIGGWCLGNAYFAWKNAAVWRWSSMFPSMVYIWSFGLLETFVLLIFRDKLITSTPLAILYLLTLTINLVCACMGIAEWYRLRPRIKHEGKPIATWVRIILVIVLTFVGLTTVGMLINSAPIVEGQALPEKVSLFTVYAFAMFYLALFLGGITIIRVKNTAPIHLLAQEGIVLVVPITTASIIYFRNVNFMQEIGAFLYIFIYLLILAAAIAVVYYYRHAK